MFDSKFMGKYEISNSQYRRVFYKLCVNAKKLSKNNVSFDPRIISEKIDDLENKSHLSADLDWITKKLVTGTGRIKKQSKNNKEIKEIKKDIDLIEKQYLKLKNKKGAEKEILGVLKHKITKLKKIIETKNS